MEAGLQTLGGSGRTTLPDSLYRTNLELPSGMVGMQSSSSSASGVNSQHRNISANEAANDCLPSPQQPHRWFHGGGRRDSPGRTSSLTSAFSGFSKGIRRSKREDRLGGKKGRGDIDEDDDVILDADSSNIVTYHDITLLRNNGGNKYGYGAAMDDTTPIIPTVVTREHKNMNNIEYRKHMVSQKKMAFSMAARQNAMQDAGAPRAMSLQTIGPRSPLDQHMVGGAQTQPGPYMQQYGPRANSLASAPVGSGRYRPEAPPFGMSYYAPGPVPGQAPAQRPNGMKAMSFTGRIPYSRMPSSYGANAAPRGLPTESYGAQYPQQQKPLNYHGPPQAYSNYQSPQQYPQQYNPQHQVPIGPRSNSFQSPARVMPEYIRHPPALSAPPVTPASSSSQGNSINTRVDSPNPSDVGNVVSTSVHEENQERILSIQSPLQQEIQRTRSGTSEGKLNVVKLADQKQREMQLAPIQEMSSPKKDGENHEVSIQHMETGAPKAEQSNKKVKEQTLDVATRPSTTEIDLNPSNLLVDSARILDADDSLDLSKDDDSFPWFKDSLTSGPESRTSESEGSSAFKPVFTLNDNESKPQSSAGDKDVNSELHPRRTSEDDTFVSAAEIPETLVSDTPIKEFSIDEKNNTTPQTARIWRVTGNRKDIKEKENGFMKAKNFLRKISTGRSKNQSATETPSSAAAHSSNTAGDSVPKLGTSSTSTSSKSLKSGSNGPVEKRKNSGTSTETRTNKMDSAKSTPLRKHRSFQSLFSGTSTPTQRLKSSSAAPICSEQRSIRSQSISETHAEYPPASAGVTYSNSSGSTSQTGKHSKLYRNEGSNEARSDTGSTSDSSMPENLYIPSFAKGIAELEPAMIISSSSKVRKFQTISISPEQMNILTSNRELMTELHIISQELAQSIARETRLEQQLYSKHNKLAESNSFCLMDFEVELRKKSAKIVELIQGLNEERLKRFIAEEQVLLTENGAKPNSLDLVYKINLLQKELEVKNNEIRQLRERISTN